MDPAPPVPVPGVPRSPWVRHLPWVGLAVGILDVAFLTAVWIAYPGQLLPLAGTIPLLFTAGKEAAIPGGIALGATPLLVAATMILTDTAATLVLYPLVHLTMDSLEDRQGFLGRHMPFVGRMLRSAVRRAERKRHIVDRYGVAGLYAFAIIPFAFNGPPIVAALGRLAGLRAYQVVPVLVAAIVTTTVAWAWFYSIGFAALEHVSKWIPLALSLGIMVVMLGIAAIGAKMDRSEDVA
ncbi:MAG: small multi-drug export protein [Thermoplasmatota archaeon]